MPNDGLLPGLPPSGPAWRPSLVWGGNGTASFRRLQDEYNEGIVPGTRDIIFSRPS